MLARLAPIVVAATGTLNLTYCLLTLGPALLAQQGSGGTLAGHIESDALCGDLFPTVLLGSPHGQGGTNHIQVGG